MILVTGATGFIGRHLVPLLVEAGWPVRVFIVGQRADDVRLPWSDIQVDVASGNLDDQQVLTQAMENVHTVFHLASAQWWGSRRDLQRVDVQGTNSVIRAAQTARVGRLVVMSHIGAAPSSAYGLLWAKGQMEALVRASGIPYTIVRSGLVFGPGDSFVNSIAMLLRANPFVFIQPGQGETLLHPLFIEDLAAGLVRSMENLDTVDRVLEVGGPEYMSFNEMVRTVMRVTHAPRLIIGLPPYVVRWLTGLVNRVVFRWPTTRQWFDILASHRTVSLNSMSDTFGIQPLRFEDTITTYMRGRRYLPQLLRFLFRRRPRGYRR